MAEFVPDVTSQVPARAPSLAVLRVVAERGLCVLHGGSADLFNGMRAMLIFPRCVTLSRMTR